MMVIFVSQCEKNALKRTRRVLDAFAERIGDNTWQTVITKEGLQAVQKLLRKTASKSTAVSCHWLRSRSRSDLLWVVGNRRKFNDRGVVPVNATSHPPINTDWENNWQYATSIQIMATLAALFHDVGKSSLGFQTKLFAGNGFSGDPYRHEWISLRLFEWLVDGAASDEIWLHRLLDLENFLQSQPLFTGWQKEEIEETSLAQLPPLAQWLGWLLVCHHRLPFYDTGYEDQARRQRAKENKKKLRRTVSGFFQFVQPVDFWVKNPKAMEKHGLAEKFFTFERLVISSPTWQKTLRRWAKKALHHPPLMALGQETVANPLLLHLSRLCLMLGDYNYSSLHPDDRRRVQGSANVKELAANTQRKPGKPAKPKQALDEHLLGVAKYTAHFARFLPTIATKLPTLRNHEPLLKNTATPGFLWQNKAFQLARTLQKESESQGFFGVNMASTGCGKTLGNARIMYGLANPDKGSRFTIALGLRVLTLQTGESLRKNLTLSARELAILVGGAASQDLFAIRQENEEEESAREKTGSASTERLFKEEIDSAVEEKILESFDEKLGVVIADAKAKNLLFSPLVSCTIDHLIQASECKRGGRYILPWLRLLTSDIILDEPDDFSQEDLPALTRLVHLAGLCGSRLLLSSATLTPDFVAGLFQAYRAGRILWNNSQNLPPAAIPCAWFDERKSQSESCPDAAHFQKIHRGFTTKRALFLQKAPVRRMGDILPMEIVYDHEKPQKFYLPLAEKLLDAALSLHRTHHLTQPESGKTVSIGLVRMANITPLMQVALALYQLDTQELHELHKKDGSIQLHLCCYHARQLLCLRSGLEEKLDRILKRDEKHPQHLFTHPEIENALESSPARHHLFIVLASPVAEIGRDHDYDWAIVEPSSMRSLIQLAGRIGRHRPHLATTTPNILVWQYNIRALRDKHHGAGKPVFYWPGFEDSEHLLTTHDGKELYRPGQLAHITAIPRIVLPPDLEPQQKLADLEHRVMRELLNNEEINFVNAYWLLPDTANRANVHLQRLSPFRAGRAEEEWVVIPGEDKFDAYYAESIYEHGRAESKTQNQQLRQFSLQQSNPNLSPWLTDNVLASLERLQQKNMGKSIEWLAIRYARVELPESQNGWYFHEWFGFWKVD